MCSSFRCSLEHNYCFLVWQVSFEVAACLAIGAAPNVIPDFVMIEGPVRTLNQDFREKIFESMKKIVYSVAAMCDAPGPETKFVRGHPAIVLHCH